MNDFKPSDIEGLRYWWAAEDGYIVDKNGKKLFPNRVPGGEPMYMHEGENDLTRAILYYDRPLTSEEKEKVLGYLDIWTRKKPRNTTEF